MPFYVLIVAISLLSSAAPARDNGQFKDTPEHIQKWFKALISPRTKISCCDEVDGRHTAYEVREGTYHVPINGKWYTVPSEAFILNKDNPTGEGIVFYYIFEYAPNIVCFVPNDLY